MQAAAPHLGNPNEEKEEVEVLPEDADNLNYPNERSMPTVSNSPNRNVRQRTPEMLTVPRSDEEATMKTVSPMQLPLDYDEILIGKQLKNVRSLQGHLKFIKCICINSNQLEFCFPINLQCHQEGALFCLS